MAQENNIITIVGGSGFVGQYIVRRLARSGYRVRVIVRNPEAALSLKTAGDPGQIVLMNGNLAKPETLAGKLDQSFAVINLVGILFEKGGQRFSALQAEGAGNLAKMASAAGVQRFIQMSALGVDRAVDSHYAKTKLAGEKAVLAAFPAATILRPSIIFGAEDNFFNQFAAMAGFSPALPLIGGGHTKFQPVYVDDVAKAVLQALWRDETKGQTYELGGPRIYSFKELLQFITTIIYKPRLLVPLPSALASVIGAVNELLPKPMLTRDQVRLLNYDNVVSAGAKTFADLGIEPQSVETIVPEYLKRFAPYQKVA